MKVWDEYDYKEWSGRFIFYWTFGNGLHGWYLMIGRLYIGRPFGKFTIDWSVD